jgi:hypothetical protein
VLIGVSAGTTSGYRAIRTANRQLNDKVVMKHTPVGAAEGCDLLILIFKKPDQEIAAFGSSYTGFVVLC